MINTAECVTYLHPDKICDQISDAILDECLRQDPYSRVAIETLGGHNTVILIGEITTKADVDFASVARSYYKKIVGKDIGVLCNIVKQSPDIAQGVDTGGAGDQGIMIGYACNENEAKIPDELYLARQLLQPFESDGKAQITLEDGELRAIVLSVQNKTQEELMKYIVGRWSAKLKVGQKVDLYCNNTGAFSIGGFDGDSGGTGRKIVVDAYGPRVPVGGGAFSGKDPTKVDRSGAYMARFIALQYLKGYASIEYREVMVQLAYVIGRAEPLMIKVICDGKDMSDLLSSIKDFDCRPEAIIERFDLRKPIYTKTARHGHFGIKDYPWEKV